jgi:hypothetical protein
VEENPPVAVPSYFAVLGKSTASSLKQQLLSPTCGSSSRGSNKTNITMAKISEVAETTRADENYDESPDSTTTTTTTTTLDQQQKMKYRCKLCGQPKNNHRCPFKKKVQRTIGVMVLPVVDAYTSEEFGVITPALSEMNNFVSYGDINGSCNNSYNGAGVGDMETVARDATSTTNNPHQVTSSVAQRTPEDRINPRGGIIVPTKYHDSPNSSSISSMQTPDRPRIGFALQPSSSGGRKSQERRGQKRCIGDTGTTGPAAASSSSSKRPPATRTIVLRPEHYRAVSNPKRSGSGKKNAAPCNDFHDSVGNYVYPLVPVNFACRKRLSDTLFDLAANNLTIYLPSVLDEIGSLLKSGRENDEWDLAVAEVLTQIVVSLHCVEGDYQLDGLQRYLLGIGISS